MLYLAKSRIKGRGVFTKETLKPGVPFANEVLHEIGINHSCEPNCLILRDEHGRNAGTIVPLVYIHPGEELTCDYRLGAREERKRVLHVPCLCPKCRKRRAKK